MQDLGVLLHSIILRLVVRICSFDYYENSYCLENRQHGAARPWSLPLTLFFSLLYAHGRLNTSRLHSLVLYDMMTNNGSAGGWLPLVAKMAQGSRTAWMTSSIQSKCQHGAKVERGTESAMQKDVLWIDELVPSAKCDDNKIRKTRELGTQTCV